MITLERWIFLYLITSRDKVYDHATRRPLAYTLVERFFGHMHFLLHTGESWQGYAVGDEDSIRCRDGGDFFGSGPARLCPHVWRISLG
jgi:hypothetical protein